MYYTPDGFYSLVGIRRCAACEGKKFVVKEVGDGNVEGGILDLDMRYLEIIRVGYLCAKKPLS